jgi:hypothetical protein
VAGTKSAFDPQGAIVVYFMKVATRQQNATNQSALQKLSNGFVVK